ncbi:MAG: hypothetical protein KME45_23195 [Stenomitos rutilans HA7619-LM2]|jgi:hypothetical protein|nr:hypothetical protein [Stenomitos rutilans HA7619-LM2]
MDERINGLVKAIRSLEQDDASFLDFLQTTFDILNCGCITIEELDITLSAAYPPVEDEEEEEEEDFAD